MKVELNDNDREMLKRFSKFEHKCAVCGKVFECSGEYIYKHTMGKKGKNSVYFCSWTCFRKDEAERENNRVYHRRI